MHASEEKHVVDFLKKEMELLKVWREIIRRKDKKGLTANDSESYRRLQSHTIRRVKDKLDCTVEVPELLPLINKAIAAEEKYFLEVPIKNLVNKLRDDYAKEANLSEMDEEIGEHA